MVEILQTQSIQNSVMVRKAYFDTDRMAGTVPVWEANATVVDDVKASETYGPSLNMDHQKPSAQTPKLSFGEFLDIVNPLHHIPVVNKLYRKYSGDEISPVAQIIGDGIYGGPIGAAASIVNAAMQEHSGQTMADTVATAFSGKRDGGAPSTPEVRLTQKEMPPQKQQWHFNT